MFKICTLILGVSITLVQLSLYSIDASASQKKCVVTLNKIASTVEPRFREIVEIRDGDKQFPPTTFFDSAYVSDYSYYQDIFGDKIRVSIYPSASPYSDKNIFNSRQQNSVQLLTKENAIQIGTNATPIESDYQIAERYALKQFAQKPDAASLRRVTEIILKDPSMLATAKKNNLAIKNSRKIDITNYGENRYFWFKPQENAQYVAARILDIHRRSEGAYYNSSNQKVKEAFVFLVEYLSDKDPLTDARTRVVLQLTEEEFRTVTDTVPGLGVDRISAMEVFKDSLTPNEIETLKLAQQLQLKLFGFFDINRGPGLNARTLLPLESMNSFAHLAIYSHITETFGEIKDLYTVADRNLQYVNFMDVFSRLDPRYVMQRFGTELAADTEFYWVITEDGQLKVMPSMKRRNNLKPQLLRFAAGRKIFAGGVFYINSDNTLNILLNANDYQQSDVQWGEHFAFQTDNPHLNEFIQTVFAIQMGYKIKTLQSEEVQSWYLHDISFKDIEIDFSTSQSESRRSGQTFKDTMFTKAQEATSKSDLKLSWDIETSKPLELAEYAKKLKKSENSDITRSQWAHYVLQTDATMTYEKIKSKFRKLAMKFHPDRNESKDAAFIMQQLSVANQILEKQLK